MRLSWKAKPPTTSSVAGFSQTSRSTRSFGEATYQRTRAAHGSWKKRYVDAGARPALRPKEGLISSSVLHRPMTPAAVQAAPNIAFIRWTTEKLDRTTRFVLKVNGQHRACHLYPRENRGTMIDRGVDAIVAA